MAGRVACAPASRVISLDSEHGDSKQDGTGPSWRPRARRPTRIDGAPRRGFTPSIRNRKERRAMTTKAVQLLLYRWAGQWGPFKVNIPCGEWLPHGRCHTGHPRHRTRRHPGRGGNEGMADRVVEAPSQGRLARSDRDGGRQGGEPGPCTQPRRAHRIGNRRARGTYRSIRQPSLRQGDLPPLRACEGLLCRCRHRPHLPRPWSRIRARSTKCSVG